MAIINITVDTEKKTIIADVDGKKFKDISSVHCYQRQHYDNPSEEMIDVSIDLKPKEENGVKYYTYMMAYASEAAKKVISSMKWEFVDSSKHIISFVKNPNISESIRELLGYNKK